MPTSHPDSARTVEIRDDQLKGLQAGGLMVAHGLRSLEPRGATEGVQQLLKILAGLMGTDPQTLIRRSMDSESHLSLRSLQQSSVAYAKLWERVWRSWSQALVAFEEGSVSDAVPPLAFMSQSLPRLPEMRGAWAAHGGYAKSMAGYAEGTRPEHCTGIWLTGGMKTLGQDLNFARLHALTKRAEPRVAGALKAIASGAYGEAELSLRQALHLDPGHGEARLMLGELLRRTERLEESRVECHHLLEGEAIRQRLATGPGGRLHSQVRQARAHLCLTRTHLVEAQLAEALTHAQGGMSCLEWSLRHATPDILPEADRSHLQAEAHSAFDLLDRLCEQVGADRPARLRH